MNIGRPEHLPSRGMTLIEMSIVIAVLVMLMSTGLFFGNKMSDWKAGRDAAESLRTVYSAQRMFLADNPTVAVANITEANIISYLPTGMVAVPTIKPLKGNNLAVRYNVSPPTINNGAGGNYDPSGSTTDLLWDLGP